MSSDFKEVQDRVKSREQEKAQDKAQSKEQNNARNEMYVFVPETKAKEESKIFLERKKIGMAIIALVSGQEPYGSSNHDGSKALDEKFKKAFNPILLDYFRKNPEDLKIINDVTPKRKNFLGIIEEKKRILRSILATLKPGSLAQSLSLSPTEIKRFRAVLSSFLSFGWFRLQLHLPTDTNHFELLRDTVHLTSIFKVANCGTLAFNATLEVLTKFANEKCIYPVQHLRTTLKNRIIFSTSGTPVAEDELNVIVLGDISKENPDDLLVIDPWNYQCYPFSEFEQRVIFESLGVTKDKANITHKFRQDKPMTEDERAIFQKPPVNVGIEPKELTGWVETLFEALTPANSVKVSFDEYARDYLERLAHALPADVQVDPIAPVVRFSPDWLQSVKTYWQNKPKDVSKGMNPLEELQSYLPGLK